jgi:site-specific DNA recombinase
MGPTFSSKNGVRYRFYVSTALRGRRHAAGSVRRVSAQEIENLVEEQLRKKLNAQETDVTGDQLFGRIQRVVISALKIQITLTNMRSNKRPIEIPWASKPKDEIQVHFAPSETNVDPKLIKAIVRAEAWLGQLSNNQFSSIEELAAVASYNAKVIRQGLRFAFLPPIILKAALDDASSVKLKLVPKSLPLSWRQQQRLIG